LRNADFGLRITGSEPRFVKMLRPEKSRRFSSNPQSEIRIPQFPAVLASRAARPV
jgi:hypothetical protein